jgi:copper oxidase (laccase) domain-containing protein
VLICRALEEKGFVNGFSTRLGGVSPFPENDLNLAGFGEDADENIFENRRRFLEVFENDFLLSTVWQVHGDAVKVVKTLGEARDGSGKFDALASNLPNILAGIKTADCVPVLIGDAKTKAFAAIHAGLARNGRINRQENNRKNARRIRRETGRFNLCNRRGGDV